MLKACFSCVLLVCVVGAMALSGYGDTGTLVLDNVAPVTKVLSPDGGEIWYIGTSYDIIWAVTDSNPEDNPIDLFYSLDDGASFISILENTQNDGTEPWLTPLTASNYARVKVRAVDAFGNISEDLSLNTFTLEYVPPQPPGGVNVDASNGVDAVLSWLPVTQTIYGAPITPDGYFILFSETPSASIQGYFFLGETDALSYTHQNVVQFRDHMYYRVVAYVDPSGRMPSLLDELQANHLARHSLEDIKAMLHKHPGGDQ